MPSAVLADLDTNLPSLRASSRASSSRSARSSIGHPRDKDATSHSAVSSTQGDENQKMPPSLPRHVSFHSSGGSVPGSPVSGSQTRANHRHSRSHSRSLSRTRPRTREAWLTEPSSPGSEEAGLDFQGMVDAYHQQTLKLKDIAITKNEQHRRIQASVVKKMQQLSTVRRQVLALQNIRDKRLVPPGYAADLKRTLKWQDRVLDEQLAEDNRRLEAHCKKTHQLFVDVIDGNRYKALNAKICQYGDLSSVRAEGSAAGSSSAENTNEPSSSQQTGPNRPEGTTTTSDGIPDIGENLNSARDVFNFADSLGTVDYSLLIPEWFAVLEAKKCVPLLSKGVNSRYIELVNKITRLEQEMRDEEKNNSLQPGPTDADLLVGMSQPVDYAFMPNTTAKEQYDELMAKIDSCMATVTEWDRNVVRTRQAAENTHVDEAEDHEAETRDDDIFLSD